MIGWKIKHCGLKKLNFYLKIEMDRETKKYGQKCMEEKDQQNCRPPPLAKNLLKDGGT